MAGSSRFSSPNSSFRSVKRCFFLLIFFNVQVCFAYIYVCIPCVHVACGGQEKVSDSLELKLQMVVSHWADARNQTWVFLTAISLALLLIFLLRLPAYISFSCI